MQTPQILSFHCPHCLSGKIEGPSENPRLITCQEDAIIIPRPAMGWEDSGTYLGGKRS